MLSQPQTAYASGFLPAEPLERSVDFKADDGFPLTGTLFENQQETAVGPLALISSAAAVPRGFYSHLARRMIALGCRGVLTYDYRGLPGSPKPTGWVGRINMIDWGKLDFPAAMKTLDSVEPGRAMVGIGHSYGGQALGISGCSARFARYAAVATLSGYWRNTREPWSVLFRMNGIGVPATWFFGKTPAWLSVGEPMPGTVFRDWARWCRSPRYFFDDVALEMPERFSAVKTPILSLGLIDDVWGTPKANAALMDFYGNAPVEQLWLGPADADGARIGHLGFFRRRFADTLWPRLTDWLLES